MARRLPAEWEEQDGVLLAWPHEKSDWFSVLPQVEPVFSEIARQISHFQRVVIVAPERRRVLERLRMSDAELARVTIFELPTNDTWTRDFGPITVLRENVPELLDFGFKCDALLFQRGHGGIA